MPARRIRGRGVPVVEATEESSASLGIRARGRETHVPVGKRVSGRRGCTRGPRVEVSGSCSPTTNGTNYRCCLYCCWVS